MRTYSCAALSAIAQVAESSPRSPAIIEPDGLTLSYPELWAEIGEVTERLNEAGVGSGKRVAVLLTQGMQQVIAVLGVLNRHACIPLQSRTTTDEVAGSLRRLSASALITSPEFAEEADAAARMGLPVL